MDWRVPWLSTKFVDGTPIQSGTIFSAVNDQQRIAVRIVQNEPTGEEYCDWTVELFGEAAETISVLVISVVLTDLTESIVSKRLHRWIRGELNSD